MTEHWPALLAAYVAIAIAWCVCLTILVEVERKQSVVRKTLATMAALWLVWPLALVGGLLFLLVRLAIYMTRYPWSLRDKVMGHD